jgi:hypothetical protein
LEMDLREIARVIRGGRGSVQGRAPPVVWDS